MPLFLLFEVRLAPQTHQMCQALLLLWSCGVRVVSCDFALSGGKQADDISDKSDLKSEASSATQSAAKKAAANTPNAAPWP